MCGIALLSGPRAAARLPECLNRLHHRGPDDRSARVEGDAALGFTRLAINGSATDGRQPYRHGDLIGVVNGEIYNHRALSRARGLPASECDARIVLPLFARNGPRVIDDLDGFYSAVALRPAAREAICLRDHIGKKPLFVGRSMGETFIVSEMKAVDACDWFRPLPLGVAKVDLDTGEVARVAAHRSVAHRPAASGRDLKRLFANAVRKRMPRPNRPVGVFLSGGLDSALVAAFASRLRDDAIFFTLGGADDPDRRAAEAVIDALDLRDARAVPPPAPARIPELVRAAVCATESFNPSIVSNGVATYLLAEAARKAGVKVVLTGEGADELFGGYHLFCERDPWRETRERLIGDMQFTELRRLDMSCMAHGVEPRCPFLDRAVRGFSDGLGFRETYDGGENKVALRRGFEGVLPPEILHRRKTSFDVGSGVRREVVRYLRRNGAAEREELKAIWSRRFTYDASAPYFHAYPVFDAAIDRRGETHR